MKPIRLYLDEAVKQGAAKNDSDIATKLHINRSAVSAWRSEDKAPSDEQAIALARLIGKNEAELLAECAAARAKSPEVRKVWERVARMASTTAAGLVLFPFGQGSAEASTGVVNLLLSPTGLNVAQVLKDAAKALCIM